VTELKVKHKVRPRTDHEVPEVGKRYSSTLSLTSVLDRVGGQNHATAALFPGKRKCSHSAGGFVSPRAGMEVPEYLAPTGIRSLDRPARSESLYRLNCPMIIHAILQLVICRNSRHFQIDSERLFKSLCYPPIPKHEEKTVQLQCKHILQPAVHTEKINTHL
jgi:hypothetical protein